MGLCIEIYAGGERIVTSPVRAIDVELAPVLVSSTDAMRLARCEGLFEDFCTVTARVKHGIPVHVSLKQREDETAA